MKRIGASSGAALSTGALWGAAGSARAQEAPAGAKPEADWIVPELISTYGGQIDALFYLILVITTVVAVGVLGLMIYSMIAFRYSEGRRAKFTHGSNKLEIGWTVATSAILVYLAVVQKDAWTEIKQELPAENEAFLVRVFAERFAWHFVYPGTDGTFETNDDADIFPGINDLGLADPAKDVVLQELIVPKSRKVILELISKGKFDPNTGVGEVPVLHSFFSPHMRLKHDIVPYFPQRIWFEVLPETQFDSYEIACAELCGQGHYQMNAQMRVLSDDAVTAALGYDWKAPGAFPARFAAAAAPAAGD